MSYPSKSLHLNLLHRIWALEKTVQLTIISLPLYPTIPFLFMAPKIFLRTLRSKHPKVASSLFVSVHVSDTYVSTGCIRILYNLHFVALKILCDFSCGINGKITSIRGEDSLLYFLCNVVVTANHGSQICKLANIFYSVITNLYFLASITSDLSRDD